MYHIFYGNNIIFDPYGNENEVVTNASLNASINAASYLDFTMAITHPLYDVIAEKSGIVKLLWDDNVLFEGQIESIDIDMHGNKTISCVSALDYLNDTIVRPYSTISGERPLTAPSSVDGYFQWLIDQHNLHVKDSSKLFYVGVNQGANLQYNNFIYRSSSNNSTTASEITNQILDSLGGYLTMRYEDGRHVLDLYSDVHTMNAQIIDFGVNLKDFSKKIKTNEQYTALIAKGGSPQLLNGGFESGDFSYWETHPNTEITKAKAQEGSYSSYIVEGVATYIPTSFFYAKKNGRYKSTLYVKNERSSDVTVYAGYETNVLDSWSKASEKTSFVIKNDDQWHECMFEFTVNMENNTKVRPYWYSDNISNAGGARVYFDGFAFTRTISGNPVNEDPIDISLIPDGGTQYDSNVIKSDDVIYNPDRVSRYGYREKVFTDSTITDLDDLMQAAIKELNKLAEPTIGLDVKAVDLALYMDGYTHLTVGDAVRVRSAIHDTDEYLMVTSINLNLEDPGNSEYVIGQAYDSLTGQQSGYLRSLSSGINSSLDAVAALDETAKDQAIKIGNVTEVANKAQETANTANTKAENAQTAADNAQAAADSNENAIDAANAEIEAAKQSIANAEGEIVTVNGRIDTMNGQIESINHDITGVNGRIDSMNDEIGAVNGIIDSTNDRIDSMNGEIETVSGNVNTLRNDLNNQVSDLNTQIETVSGSVDSANERINTLNGQIETVSGSVDSANERINTLNGQIETVSGSVDSLRTEVSTEVQNVKDSVDAVSSKADSAMDKASVLAGNLDSTNAIVNQHSDKIGELTTSISNATTKADSALQVATEATQTANSFKTTATTAYENANEALTQSSTAVQKANEVSLNLSTNYQTKADSDALYATQASLKATSDSITSTVEKTYATKSSVETLQNIADSAIETWVGSEVPTGSNKPASGWNTTVLKKQHSGDIYYDTSTGYSYRYGSSDGTTYSWTMIKDSDIQKAIRDAADAQLAANGAQDSIDKLALDIPNIYATKTELTQTSDSIKASVSEVTKTANSALSKATTVEQTANGLKTTVSEQATKLNNTVKTVSEVKQTTDSLTSQLSLVAKDAQSTKSVVLIQNPGFETGDLTGWTADNWSNPRAEKFDKTLNGIGEYRFNGFAQRGTSNYSYLRSKTIFGAIPGKTYKVSVSALYADSNTTAYMMLRRISDNARPQIAKVIGPSWTSFSGELTVPSDWSIGDNVRFEFAVQGISSGANRILADDFSIVDITDAKTAMDTANSALSQSSTVQQTLTSFKTSVQQTYETKQEALNKQSTLNQTIDGFKTNVAQTYETKNDALNKQSTLNQTIDGFKTNVSQTYETKADALNKQSTLNQTIDGFKTTVSQTYTTKTDFNNLQIGGTNRALLTGTPKSLTGNNTSNQTMALYTMAGMGYELFGGDDVMISYDITASGDTLSGIYHIQGNGQTGWNLIPSNSFGKLSDIGNGKTVHVEHKAKFSPDSVNNFNGFQLRMENASGTLTISNFKIEKGNKATAWSPAPEDIANTYATKSEVTQTADRLTSQMSQTATDASNANEKATSALTKASSLEQSLNGFKTTVSQTYETKQDALKKQSTLNQTIDGFKTNVAQTYETKTDALNKQSTLKQTIDGFKTNVSQTYATKTSLDATNGKVTQAQATGDQAIFAALPSMADKTQPNSWLCAIFPTGNGSAQSLPSYSLIASLAASDAEYRTDHGGVINGSRMDYHYGLIRTLVSFAADKTWTFTYSHDDGSRIYVDGVVVFESVKYTTNDPATITFTKGNHIVDIMWSNGVGGYGVWGFSVPLSSIATTMYAPAGASALASDLANVKTTYATKSEVTQTADSLTSQISQVATNTSNANDKASSALTKASSLEQSLNGFKTTVSQTYETKQEALNKQSTLNQTIDGFKTNVAQTYETKNDALNKQSTLNQTIDGFKTNVSQTYATKTSLNTLSNQANVTYAMTVLSGKTNYWIRLGTATISEQGRITQLTLNVSKGNNGQPDQNAKVIIQIHRGWAGGDANHQFGVSVDNANWKEIQVKAFGNATNKVTIWVYNSVASFLKGNYTVSGWRNSWEDQGLTQKGAPAGTEQQVAMNVSLEDVNDKATSALTKSSELEQTLDGFKTTVSQKYETKQDALNKQSTLNQTIDGFKTTASQTYETKTDALSKQSTINQRVDSISSTVTQKAQLLDATIENVSKVTQTANSLKSSISQTNKNIEGITTNVIKNPGFETGGLEQWAIDGGMSNVYVNNQTPHGGSYKLVIATPSTGSWTMKSNTVTVVKNHTYEISCWVWADKAVNAKLGIYAGGYYSTNDVAISASTSWQRISVRRTLQNGYSDARISFGFPNAISESNNIRVDDFELRDITEGYDASGVANSALTKASTLEQTVDGFKTTVSQTYEKKTDSLAKQSALTQKVDSLRSEVSETYATKTQLNNASSTTNMWPNQWFDTSKPCIGRAPVGDEIEAAPVGGNIRIIDRRDHYNGSVSSSVMPGRKYKVSVDAKKVSGTKSVISGGIWYAVQSSGNAWDGVGDFTNVKDYGNGWHRFERTVTVPNGKTMGAAWLQLGENSGSNKPAKWKISNLRFEDVTDIADIQANYSTKSYVDQTARTVSLGVVEEYKNGQHGSSLATQSDISVAKDSITSTVSKTYLSKSDASTTYSSKSEVKQTVDGLNVTIGNLQSTANTANSNATNAQNRVGNLETCIKMTADGVRVGKIDNGNFSGYSALVNSAGSFDILDATGSNKLISVDSSGLKTSFVNGSPKVIFGALNGKANMVTKGLLINGISATPFVSTIFIKDYQGSSHQYTDGLGTAGSDGCKIIYGDVKSSDNSDIYLNGQALFNNKWPAKTLIHINPGWYIFSGMFNIKQNASNPFNAYLNFDIIIDDGIYGHPRYYPDFRLFSNSDVSPEWRTGAFSNIPLYIESPSWIHPSLTNYTTTKNTMDIGSHTYITIMRLPFANII